MWSRFPSEAHSLSLQVFDADGVKVLGQDSLIGDDSLYRILLDKSALQPGEYVVKLIVYDYNTRVSAPGTISRIGARFDREVVIATIEES